MMDCVEREETLLGTLIRIKCFCDDSRGVDLAFTECRRIEQRYSRFLKDNDLASLNDSIGEECKVGEELFGLLEFGESLRRISNGAFNLCVAETLNEWGYRGFVYPDKKQHRTEKKEGIELKRQGFTATLTSPVDLGALGKGYAVDQMAKILRNYSKNFLIDAGGDIFAAGSDLVSGHDSWKIAFEHPLDSSQAIGLVDVSGFSVASSAPNRRKWDDKHHLINAREKKPANDCLAVYVQAEKAMQADAYSTMLFVVGFEEAKKLIKKIPAEAMLVSSTGRIWKSEGFKGELFI